MNKTRPIRSRRNETIRQIGLLTLAASLFAASCGTNAETESAGGNETVAPAEEPGKSATDEQIQAARTELPYGLDELAGENRRAELVALAQDILGPTDNAAKETNRLVYFPDIVTPKNATIVGVSAQPTKYPDSSTESLRSSVTLSLDADVETIITYYKTSTSQDWTASEESTEVNPRTDNATTTVELTSRTNPQDELEIAVVDDTEQSKRFVTLTHRATQLENTSWTERFDALDDVLVPEGLRNSGPSFKAFISGEETISFQFSALHDFESNDRPVDGLYQEITDAAEEAGYQTASTIGLDVLIPADGHDANWKFNYFGADTPNGTTALNISGTLTLPSTSPETTTS